MDRADLLLAVALAVGLILTAQIEAFVRTAGFATISPLVWIVGYGSLVFVAWYTWIRPIDF